MSAFPSENESEKKMPFFFVGNQTALDLANTLAATKDGPLDLLPDLSSLCRWLLEAKLADQTQIETILRTWSVPSGEEFLSRVKTYRMAIKEVVTELRSTGTVPTSFINETNRLLKSANAILQIKSVSPRGYSRTWNVDWAKPDSVLGVLVESGVQLVCECDLNLVRKCESPQCVLTFYDTTKSHQRRWCIMEVCGNRHKAALHRQKLLASQSGKTS